MTRLGIVIAVGFWVGPLSFVSLADCFSPTPLQGAARCAVTIKIQINELPDPLDRLIVILSDTSKSIESAVGGFDEAPQDLDQARSDLEAASESIQGEAAPLFPFINSIVDDLKTSVAGLSAGVALLPATARIRGQLTRALNALGTLTDRAHDDVAQIDLFNSGTGVLDAIEAALTALDLEEDQDALAGTELALKRVSVAINDTARVLRKVVSGLYKGIGQVEKILKIATNKRGLPSAYQQLDNAQTHTQILSLQGQAVVGSANLNNLPNGVYIVVRSDGHSRKLSTLIVVN